MKNKSFRKVLSILLALCMVFSGLSVLTGMMAFADNTSFTAQHMLFDYNSYQTGAISENYGSSDADRLCRKTVFEIAEYGHSGSQNDHCVKINAANLATTWLPDDILALSLNGAKNKANVFTCVNDPNAKYRVTFYYKAEGDDAGITEMGLLYGSRLNYAVQYLTGSSSNEYQNNAGALNAAAWSYKVPSKLNAASGWTKCEYYFSPNQYFNQVGGSNNPGYLDLYIRQAKGTIYFDDIQVDRVSTVILHKDGQTTEISGAPGEAVVFPTGNWFKDANCTVPVGNEVYTNATVSGEYYNNDFDVQSMLFDYDSYQLGEIKTNYSSNKICAGTGFEIAENGYTGTASDHCVKITAGNVTNSWFRGNILALSLKDDSTSGKVKSNVYTCVNDPNAKYRVTFYYKSEGDNASVNVGLLYGSRLNADTSFLVGNNSNDVDNSSGGQLLDVWRCDAKALTSSSEWKKVEYTFSPNQYFNQFGGNSNPGYLELYVLRGNGTFYIDNVQVDRVSTAILHNADNTTTEIYGAPGENIPFPTGAWFKDAQRSVSASGAKFVNAPCSGNFYECIHNWGDGVVTKQPTVTEPGEKTYTCSICSSVKVEPIPEKGLDIDYKVKGVVFETEFEESTYVVGELPDGWWSSYNVKNSWIGNNPSLSTTITNKSGYGKVLTIDSKNADSFIAMPDLSVKNYIYEAEIITNNTSNFGIANEMQGGSPSACPGGAIVRFSSNAANVPTYMKKGVKVSDPYPYPNGTSAPINGEVNKYKLLHYNGVNYIFYNDKFIMQFDEWTSSNVAGLGFYTCGGNLNVTHIKVTEIGEPGYYAPGLNFIEQDVIYQTDFEGSDCEAGQIPEGWWAAYNGLNGLKYGWNNTSGTPSISATVANKEGYGKVLSITSRDSDGFVAMPDLDVKNYIYEAEIITNNTSNFGIGNEMQGGTPAKSTGCAFVTFSSGSDSPKYLKKNSGINRVEFNYPEGTSRPVNGEVNKYTIIHLNGMNYVFYNGEFAASFKEALASDKAGLGFYTYGGNLNITSIKVTKIDTLLSEIISTKLAVSPNVAFNINVKSSQGSIIGDTSNVVFGLAVKTLNSCDVSDIDVLTSGVSNIILNNVSASEGNIFANGLVPINKDLVDKYYIMRPYILYDDTYFYGQTQAFCPAIFADMAYPDLDDMYKLQVDTFFASSNVFRGANANTLKFTVFSDFHYSNYKYISSVADLREIFNRANQNGSSFVISGGDFCNDYTDSPELTEAFLQNNYNMPAYNIYGNHEVEGNSTMNAVTGLLTNDNSVVWGTPDGSFDSSVGYYYFESNGFRIICTDTNYSWNPDENAWEHNLDGTNGPRSGNTKPNSLAPAQLTWLENVLSDAATNDIPCIIVSHSPLCVNWDCSSDAQTLRDMFSRINTVRPGTVMMAISGHCHDDRQEILDGVYYLGVSATRNGFWQSEKETHYDDSLMTEFDVLDEHGNWTTVTKRVNSLWFATQTWFFETPLSCNVTISQNGRISVEGMDTDWFEDVVPTEKLISYPTIKNGISSSSNFESEEVKQVWEKVADYDFNESSDRNVVQSNISSTTYGGKTVFSSTGNAISIALPELTLDKLSEYSIVVKGFSTATNAKVSISAMWNSGSLSGESDLRQIVENAGMLAVGNENDALLSYHDFDILKPLFSLDTHSIPVITITPADSDDTVYCYGLDIFKKIKESTDTPTNPIIEQKSNNNIKLNYIVGAEYQIDNENWQGSSNFSGLLNGASYTVKQRIKETLTNAASEQSSITVNVNDFGDTNTDGKYDADDLTNLVGYLLGTVTGETDLYNANGDAVVNLLDLVHMKKIIATDATLSSMYINGQSAVKYKFYDTVSSKLTSEGCEMLNDAIAERCGSMLAFADTTSQSNLIYVSLSDNATNEGSICFENGNLVITAATDYQIREVMATLAERITNYPTDKILHIGASFTMNNKYQRKLYSEGKSDLVAFSEFNNNDYGKEFWNCIDNDSYCSDNVSVANGNLILTSNVDSSAKLSSSGKITFNKGTLEFKAKSDTSAILFVNLSSATLNKTITLISDGQWHDYRVEFCADKTEIYTDSTLSETVANADNNFVSIELSVSGVGNGYFDYVRLYQSKSTGRLKGTGGIGFAENWRSHPDDYKLIALTFDDAPSYTGVGNNPTTKIIDTIKKYDGAATLFVVGNGVNNYGTELLQYAIDNGFELGNHQMDHSQKVDTVGFTDEQIAHQITDLNDYIKEELDYDIKFFRPSGLGVNDNVFRVTNNLGIPVIKYGGTPTNDWNDTVVTSEDVRRACVDSAYDGNIVLMHSTKAITANIIDEICNDLYQQGYRFVTLSELFEYKGIPYEDIPTDRFITDANIFVD